MEPNKIGIIGDFNPANRTHAFTNESIQHAAQAIGRAIETVWLPTDQAADYQKLQGLFASPGSPYRSMNGALSGIRYARENQLPFIGTCGGFQHLLIEYARNVMGITDASHAESDPYASCLFITPLSCSLVGQKMEVTIKPGSRSACAYQAIRATEAYYCNFGLNPVYRESLEPAGIEITGRDENGDVRIVELATHPFFIGTLFVPQAGSTPQHPHPLILKFCQAVISSDRKRFE